MTRTRKDRAQRRRAIMHQVGVLLKKEIFIVKKNLLIAMLVTVFPILALFLFSLPNFGSGDTQRFTGQPVYQEPLSAMDSLAPQRFLESPVYPASTQIPYSATWIPFTWASREQRIWWAPNTDPTVTAIMQASILMSGVSSTELRGFPSEADLKDAYATAPPASFLAGVVFEAIGVTQKRNVHYKILINGTYAPNSDPKKQTVIINETSQALILDYGKYIDTGFVAIQRMVDKGAVRVLAGNVTNITIPSISAVQSFPRPTVQAAEAPWIFKWLPGWCLNISILFWFTYIVNKMVYDKEYEYYRFFLIMNVLRVAYFLHWLLYFGFISIFMSLALVGILYADSVVILSSWSLIWVHYLLFLWQLVTAAIFSSTIARSVQSASSIGLASTFVFSVVYIALLNGKTTDLSTLKTILSLLPWFASMRGGEIMASLDHAGMRVGLTWANVWQSQFGYLLITQTCGIILFCLLTKSRINPKRLRHSCWNSLVSKYDVAAPDSRASCVIEDVTIEQPALSVNDVTKTFRRHDKSLLTAVDKVSFKVDRGEVLGLLGHNGAGKTTLIRMLCGEISPDEGRIDFLSSVDGQIDTNPAVGVCLQHDILFPELSAKQHLQIFAGLRGGHVPSEAEVDNIMRNVGLDNTTRDE
ncbi:hypothetical protein FOL47_010603, partial [Perkinsus chesapeaki]